MRLELGQHLRRAAQDPHRLATPLDGHHRTDRQLADIGVDRRPCGARGRPGSGWQRKARPMRRQPPGQHRKWRREVGGDPRAYRSCSASPGDSVRCASTSTPETLVEKPSFRAAYETRRCIIPACGFFEWKAVEHGNQPYSIHPSDGGLFGFAGLWERWAPADDTTIDTFTVITTANDPIRPLRNRMPVILAPQEYSTWHISPRLKRGSPYLHPMGQERTKRSKP